MKKITYLVLIALLHHTFLLSESLTSIQTFTYSEPLILSPLRFQKHEDGLLYASY